MLSDLNQENKVVGTKQTRRALNDARARKIFVAADADPRVTDPLVQLAKEKNVSMEEVPTMKELGSACGISVGCAVAATVQ